jgi:ribonuclease G
MAGNVLLVNSEGPEIRVAVVEDGALAEFFVERKRDRGIVGNIYRGRVARVLPGMQAAFVDLGPKVDKSAFLYVADVLGGGDEKKLFEDSDTGNEDGDESPEGTAARLARSKKSLANRKIEDLLKPGQLITVQVVKDGIGQKGPRVTGHLSLPGRYGVFMPSIDQVGVSKRIGSEGERKRLRQLVNEARPKGAGFIVRTAAEDAPDQEIRDDVEFLSRLWKEIGRREELTSGNPGLVYADLDLCLRTVRDLLRESTSELVIDDEEQFERVRKFTETFLPRFAPRIKRYEHRRPIFDHYAVEPQLRLAVSRKVPLRSGGSLVIDQGEALTAIDINTGSFTGKGNDLEDTVTRNNLEACEEVARQLRLRNIGGIIVVDFVDMDKEGNRKKVWDAFQKALKRDRARCNVTKISELGLVEMTRKRTRESLMQILTEPCPTCEGSGMVKSAETVAYEVLREVRRNGSLVDNDKIDLEAAPRVAEIISRFDRPYLDALEKRFQKAIAVVPQKSWKPDQFRVAGKMSTDIAAEEVAQLPPMPALAAATLGERAGGGGGGGGRGGKRRRGGRGRDKRGGVASA